MIRRFGEDSGQDYLLDFGGDETLLAELSELAGLRDIIVIV